MTPEQLVQQEAERLIEAHREFAYIDYFIKKSSNRIKDETKNAIQSAIVSATTARDAVMSLLDEPFKRTLELPQIMVIEKKFTFYNDVIINLKSKL